MKKCLLMFIGLLLVVGCGSDRTTTKFEGIKSSHDYVAEGINDLKQSDVAKAIYNFNKAIQKDPSDVNNYLLLGDVYMKFKQYKRASNVLIAAIKIAPTNGDAYYMFGKSQLFLGNNKNAIDSIKKSIIIFEKQRNAEKFKKAVIALHSLTSEQQPQADQQ